ncbi:MAG TPA: glutaredoxin family protein [Mycobacteriales bacterium]|nr:glutaredoxin family protein [Mycobacteriales bacterium]
MEPAGDTGLVPPADHRVTLLTRAGCHLCDDALTALAALAGELGTGWEQVDVDADAELRGEYGDLVPVVLVDGVEHSYLGIDAPALRALLLG